MKSDKLMMKRKLNNDNREKSAYLKYIKYNQKPKFLSAKVFKGKQYIFYQHKAELHSINDSTNSISFSKLIFRNSSNSFDSINFQKQLTIQLISIKQRTIIRLLTIQRMEIFLENRSR
jgi:hypothetical protein